MRFWKLFGILVHPSEHLDGDANDANHGEVDPNDDDIIAVQGAGSRALHLGEVQEHWAEEQFQPTTKSIFSKSNQQQNPAAKDHFSLCIRKNGNIHFEGSMSVSCNSSIGEHRCGNFLDY